MVNELHIQMTYNYCQEFLKIQKYPFIEKKNIKKNRFGISAIYSIHWFRKRKHGYINHEICLVNFFCILILIVVLNLRNFLQINLLHYLQNKRLNHILKLNFIIALSTL